MNENINYLYGISISLFQLCIFFAPIHTNKFSLL
jgi:hypothetical protein